MNPEGGYTRQYRRMWDNPVFRSYQEAAVFSWMKDVAQWRDTTIRTKFGPIDLGVGELLMAEREISERFGLHRNTVRNLIQRMSDAGMIARFLDRCPHRAGTIVRIVNYVQYQWPELAEGPNEDRKKTESGTEEGPKRDRSGTKNNEVNTRKEDNYTPLPPAMDQLPPDGGEAGRDDLNEIAKPDSKARKPKTYPESFERFWFVWPNDHMGRKQSAGKAGTFDAWKKACGRDEPERIIRGATVYAENYGKLRAKGSDRADQIPMPTTWLNQKRWDGFADPAPETQQPATPEAEEFQWAVYLKTFAQCGKWPANKGPKPGEPGCQAPADLITRFVAPPPPPTAQIIVYPQQQRVAQ